MWRGKKRGRDAAEKATQKWNCFGSKVASSLFLLVVLLPSAFAKSSFYSSCFDHIRKADDNGDLLLSREEYSKLLITISGGAILLQNETPPVLSDPYTKRLQSGSQAIGIKGIQITSIFTTMAEIGFVESFCSDIYAGLLSIFDIEIGEEQCTEAFQSADLHPPNESLSPDEYSFFVVSLTKDISFFNSSFTELTNEIQDVFNDMSVHDEVQSQKGAEYLLEFCQRVAIAVEIGEVVNASMPTVTPTTRAPASKPVPLPTRTPVERPIWVQPPENLPPEYTQCRNALIASDLNNNSWLDFSEYGPLIEILSSNKIASATFGDLESIFQETYSGFVATGDSLNLSALKLGSNPSLSAMQNMIRICNETTKAIDFYEAENDYGPSLSPSNNSHGSISDSLFQDCKSSMTLSDQNRNKVLVEAEYVQFVSKMSVNIDLSKYSFDELAVVLQDIFLSATSAAVGGISIACFSPGQEPSWQEEVDFRNLCMEVHDATDILDTDAQKSLPPSGHFSPSESPSSHIVQISDELFRVCLFAIDIADKDRDDALDQVEYMRFLNRLTISEFSGLEFSDIKPVLQNGFFEVAVNGKIDVYGTKPGISRTEVEEDHLQDVCNAAYSAIEDYHNGKTFEPLVDNPNKKCILSLFEADLDHSSHLNESEYLVFLKSFAGMNATISLDTLPFLLKENYNLFSLGKDTINIFGSTNLSATYSGDALRLRWICSRIEEILEIVSKIPQRSTFAGFCNVTTRISDRDGDGFLSEDEYTYLVVLFSAGSKTVSDFDSLDDLFRRGYNKIKNISSGLVGIEESKPDSLCETVHGGVKETRSRDAFFQLCSMAANISDLDANGNLNVTEYGPFIKYLLNVFNMTNSSLRSLESLNPTYNETLFVQSSSEENVNWPQGYHKICKSMEYSFGITNSSMTRVSIRNSFFITNSVGISSSNLTTESKSYRGLDKAYTLFVEDEVLEMSSLRRRNAAVQSSSLSDPEINQILDVFCPTESQNKQNCLEVDASFSLAVSHDDDSSYIINFYGNKTKKAIENGILQQMLQTIDPDTSLFIMNYTELYQPAIGPTEPSEEENPSSDGKSSFSLFVVLAVAIGASFFGAGLFYFLTNTRRKFAPISFNANHDGFPGDELHEEPKHRDTYHSHIDRNSEDLELGKLRNSTDFVISTELDDDCTAGISETTRCPEKNHFFSSGFVVNDEYESENEDRITEHMDLRDGHGNLSLSAEELETTCSNEFSSIAFDAFVNASTEASRLDMVEIVSEGFDNTLDKENLEDSDQQSEEKTMDRVAPGDVNDLMPECLIEKNNARGAFVECIGTSTVPDDSEELGKEADILQSVTESGDLEKGQEVGMKNHDRKRVIAHLEDSDESSTVNSDGDDLEEVISNTFDDVRSPVVNCMETERSDLTDKIAVFFISDESMSEESESVRSNSKEGETKLSVDVESIRVTSGHDENDEESQVSLDGSSDKSAYVKSSNDDGESASTSEENESEEDDTSLVDENLDSDIHEESLSSLGLDNTSMQSSASLDSACIRESYEKYRPVIEDLIREVMPDEIENIDAMMEQFIGKEHELVATLKNMAVSEDNDTSSMCDSSSANGEISEEEETENDSADDNDESTDEESTSVEESEDEEFSKEEDESDDIETSEREDCDENIEAADESEFSEETVEEEEVEETYSKGDDTSDEEESSESESD